MDREGCEFCEKFKFDRACIGVYGSFAAIHLAMGNTKFPKEKQFKFCPNCGKAIKTKEGK